MRNPVRTGTMIAIAAASLFAAGCNNKSDDSPATKAAPAVEKAAKVHCQGINDCKGKSGCKSTANACAGQNGCKGKGYVDVASDDECKTKGGTVMATM
jgi:hypothetical protein